MEKLSIEKFREFCDITNKIYEITIDEEKAKGLSEEELDQLEEQLELVEETLESSDLSGIPFEEWQNYILLFGNLNLENTGANIDFDFIQIPSEFSDGKIELKLKGCNVRNFNFDKNTFRFTVASFDEDFVAKAVEQDSTLFPERRIESQEAKERYISGKITLKDIKQYNIQDFVALDDMEYRTQVIVKRIGLENALAIDEEIITDEDLFEEFYFTLMNDKEEYDFDKIKTKIFEDIAASCLGYSSLSTYEKYEDNPYVRRYLPEIFVDFPEGTDESLITAFKSKKLSLTQVVDNYELFKGKKIIDRLAENSFYGLDTIYPNLSDEKLGYVIENFYEFADIYKDHTSFVYRLANDIDMSLDKKSAEKFVDERIKSIVLDYGIIDNRLLYMIPYKEIAEEVSKDSFRFSDIEEILDDKSNIELLKSKGISPVLFGEYDFIDALSYWGVKRLMDFDTKNGGFLTKNDNEVLLSLSDKFLHYGANENNLTKTIRTKGWDLETYEYIGSDSPEYTEDEFNESMRRMIIYGPTDGTMLDKPIPFWELEGEFREKNPDLFLSENIPEVLAQRFYQGKFSLDDIRFSEETDEKAIREILSKNLELMFRRSGVKFDVEKMEPDMIFALAKENGSYLNLLENPNEREFYRNYTLGQFDFEGKTFEEVQESARQLIENGILAGKIPYGEKAPEYIKEKHPNLFLSQDAPEELKKFYYKKIDEELYRETENDKLNNKNNELTMEILFKKPEYIEFLKGKSLAYAKIDSRVNKFVKEFGEEKFLKLMEQDPEAMKIISEAGNTCIERFKMLLETKPDFYAQKELRENDGYTEEEVSLILSEDESNDERILQGRRLLESKKEKFRDFIITSPGYVIHCPDEKIDEFNFAEYKELEDLSKFDVSDSYRRDTAEQIITSMYSFLGYGSAKEVFKLPEVSEEELEEAIRNTGVAVSGIYENIYSLQGNLKTTTTLFDKFGSMLPGGKKNFEVYKTLNEKLDQGFDGTIDELLRSCLIENEVNFDERRLELITKNAVDVNTANKMDLIKEDILLYLRDNIQETPENIKILNDILTTALKRSFSQKEEINFVIIQDYIQKEFSRVRPDGTSFYSPHVTDHMQELIDAVSVVQSNPEYAEKLKLSVTDILKEEKEKIGKGWIRKLLDVKTKLTEKEKQDLEIRLYGQDSSYKIDTVKTLELKDKTEDGIEEAYTILKEMELPGVFTFEKGEIMFAGLTQPYSENFKKFFLANMKEILSKPEYYTEFQNMHKRMETVIKDPNVLARFQAGRYTIKELLEDIKNISFDNIEPGEHELAYRAKKAGLSQEEFEIAKTVHAKMLEREKQTVPPVEYKGKRYVGRILRIDDPLHFTIGNITTCCQRFGAGQPGESSMLHSATEENGSVFVVEEVDEYGNVIKPVAQSWTWRNGDRVCFDNVEIPNTALDELEKTGAFDEIFSVYRVAAEKMIDLDKKALGRLLEEGKITQEQFDSLVIKEVTVGSGCDDLLRNLSSSIRSTVKKAETVKPEEKGKTYSGVNKDRFLYLDSNVQYVLAENEEMQRKNPDSTLKQIGFGYIRRRESIRKKEQEIHPDLIARCKAINERAGEEVMSQSIISKLETTNISGLTKDYYSELYERSITLNFSEHDDWYILSSEGEKDIQINDSIVLPKEDSSPEDVKMSKMEYAKQFLLIAKLAMEKQKRLVVNLEREGKFINLTKFEERGILQQRPDGTIEIRDQEKMEEILKSLDESLEEAKDKRIVDTAVAGKKEDTESTKTSDEEER